MNLIWNSKRQVENVVAHYCGDVENQKQYDAKLMKMLVLIDKNEIISTVEWAVIAPNGKILPMHPFGIPTEKNCQIIFEEEIIQGDDRFLISQAKMKTIFAEYDLKPSALFLADDENVQEEKYAVYKDGVITLV